MLQANIELSAEVDDFRRSGSHPKCAAGLVGDLEGGLAGEQHDSSFVLAVPDIDRTVGIEVQYRVIRQKASQLFTVSCLEVQCRDNVGGGVLDMPRVPRQEHAET